MSQRTSPAPMGGVSVALTLLTCALWGGNPTAASFTLETLPPIAIAGIRFAMATVVMFFWCVVARDPILLHRRQVLPVLIAGLLLFVQIATFNLGVWLSNASHTSMLLNTFVFWVLLLEHFFTRADRITVPKLVGMLIAAAGVSVLLLSRNEGIDLEHESRRQLLGDLILLFSAVMLAFKFIYVKHAVKTVPPGTLIFWHDVVGVALFAVVSLGWEQVSWSDFTTVTWLGLLYQGLLVAGLCFGLQAVLLRKHSATQIAIFSFSTPLFGVAAAVLLLDEPATWQLGVAAVSVAAGITLVNWRWSVRSEGNSPSDEQTVT